MTRKLLSAMALMAAVVFTGSIAAEAADVTFGGQFRPRFEYWNTGVQSSAPGAPLVDPTDSKFINMRVRLNTNVKIDENTSGLIQFQMNTRFGTDIANGPGAPGQANDTTTDIGLHLELDPAAF